MEKKRMRCGGFLLAEVITATALLGLIVVGLMVSMNGFALVNDSQWARQRCTAAAQAQLDSLAATGKPIEPSACRRLWPGVEISMTRSPGAGPWAGLELIEVTATAQAGPRRITVRLARYLGQSSPPAARSTGLPPVRSMGVPPMSTRGILPPSVLLTNDPPPIMRCSKSGQDAQTIHGRDAHGTETPHGVTTNVAEGGRS